MLSKKTSNAQFAETRREPASMRRATRSGGLCARRLPPRTYRHACRLGSGVGNGYARTAAPTHGVPLQRSTGSVALLRARPWVEARHAAGCAGVPIELKET